MLEALLDHRAPRPPSLDGPRTIILGICGERLSGEMGVSSNSVTGVSGTGGGLRGRSSFWADLTLPLADRNDERLDDRLSLPVVSTMGDEEKKEVWFARGVFLLDLLLLKIFWNTLERPEQASQAKVSNSVSSSGSPYRLLCRRLIKFSAKAQHDTKSSSVSANGRGLSSYFCLIRR